MRKLPKYISLFLLAVISFFIVPKEAFHELYGHEDTEHETHRHCASASGINIEEEHQHCEILNFNVPLYCFSCSFFALHPDAAEAFYPIAGCSFNFTALFNLSLLRAPPVA